MRIGRAARRREGKGSATQAGLLMRIPVQERRNALLFETIDAILRNGKIDNEGLYRQALEQVSLEEGVSAALDTVRSWYERSRAMKERLRDKRAMKNAIAVIRRVLAERPADVAGIDPFSVVDAMRRGVEADYDDLRLKAFGADSFLSLFGGLEPLVKAFVQEREGVAGVEALEEQMTGVARAFWWRPIQVPAARSFNKRFLNGDGLEALSVVLVFDLLDLIPEEFNRSVGGEMQDVRYRKRPKRLQKRLGPGVRSLLDERYRMVAITPKTVRCAADRYVVYHFLSRRTMEKYKINMELDGKDARVSSMRVWFREFDDALGIERRGPGRPPNQN